MTFSYLRIMRNKFKEKIPHSVLSHSQFYSATYLKKWRLHLFKVSVRHGNSVNVTAQQFVFFCIGFFRRLLYTLANKWGMLACSFLLWALFRFQIGRDASAFIIGIVGILNPRFHTGGCSVCVCVGGLYISIASWNAYPFYYKKNHDVYGCTITHYTNYFR